MSKQEFLEQLRKELNGLPHDDIEERLSFYSEMIDDRITEEGLSEEQAVAAAGSVQDIVAQIIAETPFVRIAKEKIKPKRRLKAWEIVLLVLGSPIWVSLALIAFAVVLALYIVLWALVICLWALFVSFAACTLGGVTAGAIYFTQGNVLGGIAMIGAGIVCAGIAILMFYASKAATKGTAKLAKKIAFGIKKCFMRKEEA